MDDIWGWGAIVVVLLVPIVFGAVGIAARRRHRAGDTTAPSSAGLLGFDELFQDNQVFFVRHRKERAPLLAHEQ